MTKIIMLCNFRIEDACGVSSPHPHITSHVVAHVSLLCLSLQFKHLHLSVHSDAEEREKATLHSEERQKAILRSRSACSDTVSVYVVCEDVPMCAGSPK